MIKIKFGEESYEIKNTIREITIFDFENISEILENDNLNYIEKWLEILKYLGVSEECIKSLDMTDLLMISSHFKFINNNINLKKIRKYIVIDNNRYYFRNKKSNILVKDIIELENIISSGGRYASKLISYLYPYNEILKKEYQSSISNDIKIDVLIPILNILNKNLKNDQ